MKINFEDKIKTYLFAGMMSVFSFGYVIGCKDQQKTINELEQKVESVEISNKILKSQNYDLHLDLIKRDNPYGWELFGDSYGSWGYRKVDDGSMILGAMDVGYQYLSKE